MCGDFYSMSEVATACGWWGWQEGGTMTAFRCGCPEAHMIFAASDVTSDPDYYRILCEAMRQCRT